MFRHDNGPERIMECVRRTGEQKVHSNRNFPSVEQMPPEDLPHVTLAKIPLLRR
jgi:hypothetical protein